MSSTRARKYLVVATSVVLAAVVGLAGLVVYRIVVPVEREPRTTFEMALLEIEAAIDESPENASLRINLSDLYFQQGLLEESWDVLQEAYELEPEAATMATLDVAAARVLEAQGLTEDAKEYYLSSLDSLPLFDAYFRLGEIAAQEGEHEEAVDFWLSALELRPGNGSLRRDVATRLESLGRYQEALDQLVTLQELLPDDPDVQDDIDRLERELDGDN